LRGAAVPLLFVPIVADWIRFLQDGPFYQAWLGAVLLTFALLLPLAWFERSQCAFPRRLRSSHFLWFCGAVIGFHVLTRIWIFTGTAPNPADDVYAGYKTNPLYFSMHWELRHPEAPEAVFSYYYYAYTWVAGLAHLLGISFWAGWWATAIVLCVMGSLLAGEWILPRLKDRPSLVMGAFLVVSGACLSWLPAVAAGLPMRSWTNNVLSWVPESVYLRFPGSPGLIWGPFGVFCAGLLISLFRLFPEWFRKGRIDYLLFVALVVGGFTGYCTFYTLGFAVVVCPLLAVFVWRNASPALWLRSMFWLGISGLIAVLFCWPILHEFLGREPGIRNESYHPLLQWIQVAHPPLEIIKVFGLMLVGFFFGLPLVAPVLFGVKSRGNEAAWFILALIFWGTLVCYLGVQNDFEAKFGTFLGLLSNVLWLYTRRGKILRSRLLWLCLLGGIPMFFNLTRANAVFSRRTHVWQGIEQAMKKNNAVIFFQLGTKERSERSAWWTTMPYFAKAQFVVPVGEIDGQGRNFMRSSSLLDHLPDSSVRLQSIHQKILLLTAPDAIPSTSPEILFQDGNFVLKENIDSTP
jgi:hypothetical protein